MTSESFITIGLWILHIIKITSYYWIPVLLVYIGCRVWMKYIRLATIAKKEWIMLEIRIPKEVFKSPQAMEIFLANALHQGGGMGNWYQKYWLGNVHTWFSLEMISEEGNVRFIIRAEKKWRRLVEAQLYAQYPNIEIKEVPDYTEKMVLNMYEAPWSIWGTEFKLAKPDPFPIKTYIDYGLDKAVGSLDEEQKIDPITPMVEFLSSLGPGEHAWFQFLVRPSIERYPDPEGGWGKVDWKKIAIQEKKKILKEHELTLVGPDGKERTVRDMMNMTETEKLQLNSLEKSVTKPGFDCGIRALYLAKDGEFDPINITGLTGVFKQFNSEYLNSFKVQDPTAFDYPWQDLTGSRTRTLKIDMFDAYRRRSYFHPPYEKTPFVLNSEELATVFHLPSKTTEAPTLERIEAKRATPPPNLPI